MKKKFDEINEIIARSKNILISSHRSPDEDAVGSSLALQIALKNQGINSSVYISGYSSEEYKFLPNYNIIKSKLDHYNYDLVLDWITAIFKDWQLMICLRKIIP